MIAELQEFSSIVQGGRHGLSGKQFVDHGFPAYGAGGLNGYLDRSEFDKPGIVLSAIGARCGKCFLPEAERWTSLANTQVIFPDPDKADIRFIWYQLNDEASWTRRGAGQPFIRPADVKKRTVYFPELKEQRRIADILDKACAVGRKREQLLDFAEDFLWSVFTDMFGDPSVNPKRHSVRTFESILHIPLRNGISPSSKGMISANVLTLSAITGDWFDARQLKEGKFLERISAKDSISRSDFYICRGNGSPDLIGKGYFADRDIPGTAFPDTMIAAKPDPREVTRAYLERLWKGPYVRNQIREAARTTNGTYKINQTAAGAIKLPIPPLADQKRYQAIVDQVGRSRCKVAYGDDLFPALRQRAFRGEL